MIQEKLIDQEAIFIDGTKIEANANKFTFTWKKAVEKHHHNPVEKSNQLYNELLEKQIIPELQREDEKQLSIEELTKIAEKLEEVIEDYTQKIDNSDDAAMRKHLRSLGFTRFLVCGKSKVENEIGLALMAVNLRKYAIRG